MAHDDACFVTLTYAPEHCPTVTDPETGEMNLSLKKRDLKLWLKRLRRLLAPQKIRYYGCGEYGAQTQRPHYHLILFGLNFMNQSKILDTWGLGNITVSEAHERNMAYTAQYTLKKRLSHPDVLGGREKEWSIMSLRPPIGTLSIPTIADSLRTKTGSHVLVRGHVEKQIKLGRRTYPLDRTMMKYLATEMDIPEHIAKVVFLKNFRQPPNRDEQEKAQAFNEKAYRRAARKTQNPVL